MTIDLNNLDLKDNNSVKEYIAKNFKNNNLPFSKIRLSNLKDGFYVYHPNCMPGIKNKGGFNDNRTTKTTTTSN
jgi:hypothetical protein